MENKLEEYELTKPENVTPGKKKWHRSKVIKIFWITLMHIAAVAGVICGAVTVLLMDSGVRLEDAGKPYEMSKMMADDVFNAALDIMSGINDEENNGALSRYSDENSNITYVYADEEKNKVYTNKRGYSDLSDYNKYKKYEEVIQGIIDSSSPYIVVYPITDNIHASDLHVGNMYLWDTNVWRHTIYEISNSKHFVFAIQVDDTFRAWDTLAQNRQHYEKWSRWLILAIAGCMAAVVIILIGFIQLTITAGRKPEDEEVHLCWYDRWFTEIAAVTVAGIWLVGFLTMADQPTRTEFQAILLVAFLALYTMALFLTGYLSLVRRIKGKTLWKNSFLRWVLLKCRSFFGKSKAALAKDGAAREKSKIALEKSIDALGKSENLLKKGAKAGKKVCVKAYHKLYELSEFFSEHTGSKVKTMLLAGGVILVQFIITLFVGRYWYWHSEWALIIFVVFDGGIFIWMLKKAGEREKILDGLKRITDGELTYKIPLEKLTGEQKIMAEYINNIGAGLDAAVEKSVRNERMKTELITNVSHDIKTPLTSIINYIDLLKRENFTDEKVCGYIGILEEKAQRLKVLTEDVVEASKASTGNITFEKTNLNFVEMVKQVTGEFEEKFEEKNLKLMVHFTEEPAVIYADGRRMWRVLENIFNNVVKYAMEGTRVYASVEVEDGNAVFSLKNISAQPLNISADELTERFIRGDVSRNTEGSGLGLSIAKSLTELQGGEFKLYLDGDLFKVTILFKEERGEAEYDRTENTGLKV